MRRRFVEKDDGFGDDPYVETTVYDNGRVRVTLYYDVNRLPRKGVETQENHKLDFTLEPSQLACIAGSLAGALAESRDKVVQRAQGLYAGFENRVVAAG